MTVETQQIDLDKLKDEISKQFRVDISHKSRKTVYVIARGLFYHIARNRTKLPLADIGKYVNRDHATVVHGLKSWADNLEIRTRYHRDVNDMLYRYYLEPVRFRSGFTTQDPGKFSEGRARLRNLVIKAPEEAIEAICDRMEVIVRAEMLKLQAQR